MVVWQSVTSSSFSVVDCWPPPMVNIAARIAYLCHAPKSRESYLCPVFRRFSYYFLEQAAQVLLSSQEINWKRCIAPKFWKIRPLCLKLIKNCLKCTIFLFSGENFRPLRLIVALFFRSPKNSLFMPNARAWASGRNIHHCLSIVALRRLKYIFHRTRNQIK